MAERKKISARKKVSVEDQEKMLAALYQRDEAKKETNPVEKVEKVEKIKLKKPTGKTQRVTVDFPQEMYEQMKEETQLNGQTLRGFVVSLVRKHLANQNG
jgi:hypothetical protein